MASGYTIFLTYQFADAPYTASTTYGYGKPLHCGYVQTVTTSTLQGIGVNLFFSNLDEFSFLHSPSGSTTSTGYSATYFYALSQIVSGITDSSVTIKPDPANWIIQDLTSQIANHTLGDQIEAANLVNTLFSFDPAGTVSGATYNIDYLNYPTNGDDTLGGYPEENFRLAFGEEVFFYGNVSTDIRATAYITDIPVVLPLNEYNTSNNPTWDGGSVNITEIGIYNTNGDLVAIGKLNNPIEKNSNISRTILFAMDF